MEIVEDVLKYIQLHKRNSDKRKIKVKVLRSYLSLGKPFKCCYCQIDLTLKKNDENSLPDNYLTLEHIKPMCFFFDEEFSRQKVRDQITNECNELSNLTLSCYKCNHDQAEEIRTSRKERLGLLCRLN